MEFNSFKLRFNSLDSMITERHHSSRQPTENYWSTMMTHEIILNIFPNAFNLVFSDMFERQRIRISIETEEILKKEENIEIYYKSIHKKQNCTFWNAFLMWHGIGINFVSIMYQKYCASFSNGVNLSDRKIDSFVHRYCIFVASLFIYNSKGADTEWLVKLTF